jgi:hypothetical protein
MENLGFGTCTDLRFVEGKKFICVHIISRSNMEIQLEPFKEINKPVLIDWEYALKAVENLDKYASDENRNPIKGKAAIAILAEYGAIAYKCIYPPKNTKLAIIISPPHVRFCPSSDGLDGVFIENYTEEKHGKCFLELTKDGLFAYNNIDSRIDGWGFFSNMIWRGNK